MNITDAINIIQNKQSQQANGLLELVTEFVNGRDEDGFNPNFSLDENEAFSVFVDQAQQFFAPV